MKQKGILFVVRRPDKDKPIDSTEYIPCIYCLGFIQKTQAHKHAKNCSFQKTEFGNISCNRIVKQGNVLLHTMTTSDKSTTEWLEIKSKFRNDEVGNFTKNDATLCTWGNGLTMKY